MLKIRQVSSDIADIIYDIQKKSFEPLLNKYQSGEPKCISVEEVSEVYWMSCTEILGNKKAPVWLKESIEKAEYLRLEKEKI